MKIELNTGDLLQAAQMAAKATKKKTTLPILSCVLVVGDEHGVRVVGTDLSTCVTADVANAVVPDLFSFAVDAETFIGVLSAAGGETVSLDFNDREVKVASGKLRSKLPVEIAQDFPMIAPIHTQVAELTPDVLFGVAKTVAPFTLKGNDVRAISGVHVRASNGNAVFFGGDGYRLSRLLLPVESRADVSYIVPSDAIDLAARVMSGLPVSVFANESRITFSAPGISLSSALIDGKYPDFDSMVGDTLAVSIKVSTSDLARALKTFDKFCERSSAVRFVVQTSEIALSVKESKGEAKVTIDAESGGVYTFGLQYAFAVEAVAAAGGANILIDFIKNSSVRFRAEGNDNFYHVTGQLRLDND